MYKWIEPKVCSETVEEAVKLPASGEKQTCPPCNPGFFVTNSSACEPCDKGFYSNGKGKARVHYIIRAFYTEGLILFGHTHVLSKDITLQIIQHCTNPHID